MNVPMNLVQRAANFAKEAHKAQFRKYDKKPYFSHCEEVAQIVTDNGGSEAQIAAAYLHDVVEDQGVTKETLIDQFGQQVADLVMWLSDVSTPTDGNRSTRKAMDRQHTFQAPAEAQFVKLADLISNTKSIVAYDPDFAVVYLKEKRQLLDGMTGVKDTPLYLEAASLYKEQTTILASRKVSGKILVEMQFGSHVYGTHSQTSDLDIKGVYLPNLESLVFPDKKGKSIHISTGDKNSKNSPLDVDLEFYSLTGFLQLLEEGQTVALDMLFTPRQFWRKNSPEWEYIYENRNKLIHRNATAFIGYCYTQAAKYGLKGSRLEAIQKVISVLESASNRLGPAGTPNPNIKIKECGVALEALIDGEHVTKEVVAGEVKGETTYLVVCGKKIGYNIKVIDAVKPLKAFYNQYGERAHLAQSNKGVDWKAMSHALRIVGEAQELLTVGEITFPRPDAELLKKIKSGSVEYEKVADLIVSGINEVKQLETASNLRKELDIVYWRQWVLSVFENYLKS